MQQLTRLSETELLKMVNDVKAKHDNLKQDIINQTTIFDEYIIKKTEEINKKIENLSELEKNYIRLVEELNNRDAIR